jgi:hypothetical protein
MSLEDRLEQFAQANKFKGQKGRLCVALVVTRHAKASGFPLDAAELLTEQGGQVLGLGKSAVQAILKDNGINRVLAEEGGRTSRGSISAMRQYVAFLNEEGPVDLKAVEVFWVEKVHEFFTGRPFKLKMDASLSLRTIVRQVFNEAEERQKKGSGHNYAGTVMQHLVGAKLDCALGIGNLDHNCASTSDQQSGRSGDFSIKDVAIHVTTAPGEAVMRRCQQNLDENIKPILVTSQAKIAMAEGVAEAAGLLDRIDIFEITQFIALNVYELGGFGAAGRNAAVNDIVGRYNSIIDENETDPSLRIELKR